MQTQIQSNADPMSETTWTSFDYFSDIVIYIVCTVF